MFTVLPLRIIYGCTKRKEYGLKVHVPFSVNTYCRYKLPQIFPELYIYVIFHAYMFEC